MCLLRKWRQDDGGNGAKVPWDQKQWDQYGAVSEPVFYTFGKLKSGNLYLEGIACEGEIVFFEHDSKFRVW